MNDDATNEPEQTASSTTIAEVQSSRRTSMRAAIIKLNSATHCLVRGYPDSRRLNHSVDDIRNRLLDASDDFWLASFDAHYFSSDLGRQIIDLTRELQSIAPKTIDGR